MQFAFFDAPTGGSRIGGIIANPPGAVNQGVFSVTLDFAASVFTSADRFLQISVRCDTSESFTIWWSGAFSKMFAFSRFFLCPIEILSARQI